MRCRPTRWCCPTPSSARMRRSPPAAGPEAGRAVQGVHRAAGRDQRAARHGRGRSASRRRSARDRRDALLAGVREPAARPANSRVNLWADGNGGLLRLSIPAQTLEMAREDIASAASRTATFSVAGDEARDDPGHRLQPGRHHHQARPTRQARCRRVVLIGGSGPTDRDETVAGIPIFGQIARDLVAAGFIVVRYDKRGVGQSGGRAGVRRRLPTTPKTRARSWCGSRSARTSTRAHRARRAQRRRAGRHAHGRPRARQGRGASR